jgi:diguanylate cyclase
MHLSIETVFDFASTIAVLALLAVPYGIARDRLPDGLTRESLLGLLFGLTAVGAMLDPFVLADGIIFDMRNLPIGLAGAFLGPLGAVVAMVPTALARIAIGGSACLPA